MDLTNINNTLNQILPVVKTVAQGTQQVVSTIKTVKGGSAAPVVVAAPGTAYYNPPITDTPSGITAKQIAIGVGVVAVLGVGGYLLLRK